MAQQTRAATLVWREAMQFEGGAPDGPTVVLDGDGGKGPSPVVALLLAAAACTGADVVLVLEKMRVGLRTFRIDVTGTRRDTDPRRLVALHMVYHLAGDGLDETKARRAIDLSIEKYCSVVHSLAPDIPVTYELRLA